MAGRPSRLPGDPSPRSAGNGRAVPRRRPYEGRLDLNRVAAAGNSCGGITTMGLAGSDDRVKSAFVLSGSGSFPGSPAEQVAAVMGRVTVPVAYVVGGPEDIARANAERDVDALPAKVPALVARRAVGDHPTVSTNRNILVGEVADIAVRWLDLSLNGSPAALAELTSALCSACTGDLWSTRTQHLETLVRSEPRPRSGGR